MEIELLRDLIIVISGLIVTLVAILFAVISYSLFRRVNLILNSMKTSAAKIEALTAIATDELGKPLIHVASLVQGIAYGIQAINKIIKKEG